MFLLLSLQSNLYTFSGLGVRVVWKLFNQEGHRPGACARRLVGEFPRRRTSALALPRPLSEGGGLQGLGSYGGYLVSEKTSDN